MEGSVLTVDTMIQRDETHRDEPEGDGGWETPRGDEPSPQDAAADAPIEIVPERVVEAILFASDVPMPAAKIAAVLGVGDARDVRRHIKALNERYTAQGSAFRVEEIAGGFQMMTLPVYNRWLVKLLRARQETKLTPAAMETLAIVAYKQPCTRADIEAIRGVAVGDVLNRLREMNLIKIVGRAEDLGRPMLYGTTKRFLEVFGLPGLEDLPQVEALKSGAAAPSNGRGSAPPRDEGHSSGHDDGSPGAASTNGDIGETVASPAEAVSAQIHRSDPGDLDHPPERAMVVPRTPALHLTDDDESAGLDEASADEDDPTEAED